VNVRTEIKLILILILTRALLASANLCRDSNEKSNQNKSNNQPRMSMKGPRHGLQHSIPPQMFSSSLPERHNDMTHGHGSILTGISCFRLGGDMACDAGALDLAGFFVCLVFCDNHNHNHNHNDSENDSE